MPDKGDRDLADIIVGQASRESVPSIMAKLEELKARLFLKLTSQPSPNESKHLRDAGEVAQILNVKRSKVYELARTGDLPSVRIGRYTRFTREAIEKYLTDLQEP